MQPQYFCMYRPSSRALSCPCLLYTSEYDLVAAGLGCPLHGHAVGDEVERFDVTVQEAGVLNRNQLVGPVLPVEAARLGNCLLYTSRCV